jgi:hypothetical protein
MTCEGTRRSKLELRLDAVHDTRVSNPFRNVLACFHYRYWCMKEAYIKAVGIGLGFELKRAEFHYVSEEDIHSSKAAVFIDGVKRPEWNFRLHRLGGDHWVSLICSRLSDFIVCYY